MSVMTYIAHLLLVLPLEHVDAVLEVLNLNAAARAAVTSVTRHLRSKRMQGYSSIITRHHHAIYTGQVEGR